MLLTLKHMLRRFPLTFLPKYMRYTPLICTDKELASKDLQRYAHPCLKNSLLSFIFSLDHSLIHIHTDIYMYIYLSIYMSAILSEQSCQVQLHWPP